MEGVYGGGAHRVVNRNGVGYFNDSHAFEVTIISDFVCAWCVIGKRSLELASKDLGIPLRCVWQPYIINPRTPPEGEDMAEHLIKKFGQEGAQRYTRAVRCISHLFLVKEVTRRIFTYCVYFLTSIG